MSFDFLNRKKKAREAEEKARREEEAWARYAEFLKREQVQARIKEEQENEQARIREEQKKEQARIEKEHITAIEIKALKDKIAQHNNNLEIEASSINATIHNFMRLGLLWGVTGTYNSVCSYLDDRITQMYADISTMKKTNNSLIEEFADRNMSSVISQAETDLFQARKQVEAFNDFSRIVDAFPFSRMIDENNYGKINKVYWDAICGMVRTDAVSYTSYCEQNLSDLQHMYTIDVENVLKCVWFFAVEKPFSAADFQKAKNIFKQIYKQSHADIIIADLYAKKNIGGENALREPVRDMLKYQWDAHILTLMASSLMWMNAYQIEHMVLQHMLATGKQMTAKTQERLHSLTNGGGKAPSGFDAKSYDESLYFDVSALAWRDDEYIGLFENLAFQDKNLTYSLAIRDENKELFIPQGINVPSNDLVLKKFSSVFTEEYGNSVTVRSANCVALSGNGEEQVKGIMAVSDDCKQMGILMHMARIGKKLIIRFYTLYVPTGSDLATQKQQALSIYKNLSLSVSMWESSLKDTMLMAMEQLLNSTNQSGSNIHSTSAHSAVSDEPVF